jgi:hypothetical protein
MELAKKRKPQKIRITSTSLAFQLQEAILPGPAFCIPLSTPLPPRLAMSFLPLCFDLLIIDLLPRYTEITK